MGAFHWFESVPTIISAAGTTTYLMCDDRHYPKDKDSQEYVKAAREKGEPVCIVTRAHVASVLKDVPAKDVTDAKLPAAVLDVGSDEKAATVVPMKEWAKVQALAAKAEAVKVDDVEVVKK